MPKLVINTHDLAESDFRKIQELLLQKYGTTYTPDYIRKVCKGKRNNHDIMKMALRYAKVIHEMKSKIDKLSKK